MAFVSLDDCFLIDTSSFFFFYFDIRVLGVLTI